MGEPVRVSKRGVIAIHAEQLAEHGGPTGVRDEGLHDSALAKPRNVFVYGEEPTIFRLAASYAFGIVRNHPFVDGNKRTALVVALTFLALNGWSIGGASKRERYLTFLQLAEGNLGEEELAVWFARHAVAIG